MTRIDRREVVALLGLATVALVACDETPSGPAPTPDAVGTITENHGHEAVITAAQLLAGGALLLFIQGRSTHPHRVPLSAEDVVAIRAGRRVARDSDSGSDDKHLHTVVFNGD